MASAGEFYNSNVTPLMSTGVSMSWGRVYTSFSIGKTVFTDVLSRSNARVYINLREQELMLTIRQLYDALRASGEKDVLTLLKRYTESDEVVSVIKRLKFLDLVKLASLIAWLGDVLRLRVTNIDVVEDLETRQLQFIGIYIDGCGWDEWKILSRTVKKQLVSEGFDDIAGRVALVCRQGLKIRRS